MDDLISRQAAIDALDGEIEITGRTNAEAVKGYVRLVRDRLERLPSAQQLTAYVISDEDGNIKCSNCGSFECWGNYCMDCGAKMDGVKDDG